MLKKLFPLFAALTLSVGLWAENAFKIVNANGFQQPVNRVAQVISAYAGTTIRVVFHHQDYDKYFINIDNLGIECEDATGLENVKADMKANKIIKNGKMYLHDGKGEWVNILGF